MSEEAILKKLDELEKRLLRVGMFDKPLLTPQEAAIFTGFAESTLANARSNGEMSYFNPSTGTGEFIKKKGNIRYIKDQLYKWMLRNPERKEESTKEYRHLLRGA